MNAKEILARTPPDKLYHYTTQAGFMGIIEKREIWATHTQYLKDQREFRHAVEIIKRELLLMLNEEHYEESQALLEEMAESLESVSPSINVCVASFSARGDALSQWRCTSLSRRYRSS